MRSPLYNAFLQNDANGNGKRFLGLGGLSVSGNATKEIWIGQRIATLGSRPSGSGSKIDPYDATDREQVDALMIAAPASAIIMVDEGEYQFNATTRWFIKGGWRLIGKSCASTIFKAVAVGSVTTQDIYGFISAGSARVDDVYIERLTIDMNHAELGATATIANSVPNYKSLAAILIGSRNRMHDVRSRNTYGSLVNNRESFALGVSWPPDMSESADCEMTDCIAELPHGDYSAPFALHGVTRSKVSGCKGYGIPASAENGYTSGFNTGGVNCVYGSDNDILDSEFYDCEGIVHHDTGPLARLRVERNKARRAWSGLGLSPAVSGDDMDFHYNVISVQDRVTGGASYGMILNNGSVADGTYTGVRATHNRITSEGAANPDGAGIIAIRDFNKVTKGHWESNIIGPGLTSYLGSDSYHFANRTTTGGQPAGLEDNSMAAAVSPNIFGTFAVMVNRTLAGGHAGYDIALSSNYTVVNGDIFEIAIYFMGASGLAVSMLRKADASILDSNGLHDQNGLLGYDDVSAYAANGFYVRHFALSPYVGQIIAAVNLGAGGTSSGGTNAVTGVSRYFYRNARIIGTGGVVRRDIYTDLGGLFSDLTIGSAGSANVSGVSAGPFYPTRITTTNPVAAGQLWCDTAASYVLKVSQG